jgi:hypothetical protein
LRRERNFKEKCHFKKYTLTTEILKVSPRMLNRTETETQLVRM